VSNGKVKCLNPAAHKVETHIAGSAAAIACQRTGGASMRLLEVSKPARNVYKGNNLGNVSVLTNISEESTAWARNHIARNTPRHVASLIEVASSNSRLRSDFREFTRPFTTLVHDPDYSDDFGNNPLLPEATDLGYGFSEPNEQCEAIINNGSRPDIEEFFVAATEEMNSIFPEDLSVTTDDVRNAYNVISGYIGDEDKAKLYAVGCLRSEYLDRVDEINSIKSEVDKLAAIFNTDVDDGTNMTTHGVEYSDGKISFVPTRKFAYDEAAPIPLDNLSGEERDAALAENKQRLSKEEYASIINSWDPKYKPLAQIEKILDKETFSKFVTYGSTSLKVT